MGLSRSGLAQLSGTELLDSLSSLVMTYPALTLAILVGLFASAVGLYALRRFKRPMGTRFLESVAGLDEVAVLLHPNPDPDAMATGVAVASLVEQAGTSRRCSTPDRSAIRRTGRFTTCSNSTSSRSTT